MFSVLGISKESTAPTPTRPDFDLNTQRQAARYIGAQLQSRFKLAEAVELYNLKWDVVRYLFPASPLDLLFHSDQQYEKNEMLVSIRRYFGHQAKQTDRWIHQIDETIARKMGITAENMSKNGLNFEWLLSMNMSMNRFVTVFGDIDADFDRNLGCLTADQLRELNWNPSAYAEQLQQPKKLESSKRNMKMLQASKVVLSI
ncbi:hypothetical protein CYMTET_41414 [Cymbomonas tetramitiformis]|uniref:Uncharacterized protein n=1 Tax=Cymbomonas tetramitiformis TaxID=36881 RepID=A0AAE0C669_9CHLO|nr:hypothetical protein CYMTET_41414 [Cymbomonas tetramitiformis]